ncbi:MAG: hypothetical protein ACKOUM_11520, partial [Sphingopyxis sp.]
MRCNPRHLAIRHGVMRAALAGLMVLMPATAALAQDGAAHAAPPPAPSFPMPIQASAPAQPDAIPLYAPTPGASADT